MRALTFAPTSRSRIVTAALVMGTLPLWLGVGCVDPEGALDDFNERYEAFEPPPAPEGCIETCASPAAGEVDGTYLFTLSPSINPVNPILLSANITSADGASGVEFSMELQGLAAADRKTPVGSPFTVGPFTINADGTFAGDLGTLALPGEANPLSGSDLEATVTLAGNFCNTLSEEVPTAFDGFITGDADGDVSKPLPLNIDGSTFTVVRVASPDEYPEPPPIACEGQLADPLGG